MNRSFKTLRLLLLAGLLAGGSSCEKFVNLTPDDNIPVAGFYKSEADMKLALTALYGDLRFIYNTLFLYTELPSDNGRTFGESESQNGFYDKFTWSPVTPGVSSVWNQAYLTISNANVIIARIDAIPFANAATKTQYIGEAKFIRALMYFNLVRFYGDVPLVVNEIKSEADAYTYSRTPVAQVYAQIEKDLLDAEAALPASYTGANIGRAAKGAAQALLGKVLLQENKWADAEAKLGQLVLNPNPYQILPDLNNVFGLGKDNNAEIVFAVQYVATGFGEGSQFTYYFTPQPSGTTISPIGGLSLTIGTLDLYNAFEAGDLRRAAYVGVFGVAPNTYYYAKKLVYAEPLINEGELDWPVIRYADVLLMYAEALNNNGKTALAIPQINRIRTRAGLAAKPLTLSTADTQLAIEQERRVELCFEGHRWHDLIRWGKDVTTMLAYKATYTQTTSPGYDPATRNMTPRVEARLFPIPSRELALNPNLTQNPGY